MLLRCMLFVWMFCLYQGTANAREQIRVVGSSTVYPFVTVIAGEFGNRSTFRTPIVESTGTGGGFKLFCSGLGEDTHDFVNASRAVKEGELEDCAKHGVSQIVPIKLGYDGIVVANAINSERLNLSKTDIFLALAKHVPKEGALVPNPYTHWKQVNNNLPDIPIKVYGPPPTSGTRDAFVELVMDAACEPMPEFIAAYPEKDPRLQACRLIREDGGYVDAGEDDNLIIQKLVSDPLTLGIFGFSFLEENGDKVQGSLINSVEPTFDHIADGSYGISRPLFIYMKAQHIGRISGIPEFAKMLSSDDALGEEGLLVLKGLIPLMGKELKALRKDIIKITEGAS